LSGGEVTAKPRLRWVIPALCLAVLVGSCSPIPSGTPGVGSDEPTAWASGATNQTEAPWRGLVFAETRDDLDGDSVPERVLVVQTASGLALAVIGAEAVANS